MNFDNATTGEKKEVAVMASDTNKQQRTNNVLTQEQHALKTEIMQNITLILGGSVAKWLACWAQAQKGLGSNSSCDAVG